MSPRRWLATAAGAAAAVVLLCAGAVASCGPLAATLPDPCPPDPAGSAPAGQGQTPPATATTTPGGQCAPAGWDRWDTRQIDNAAVIVEVGIDLQVPTWGQVIAVATAMQESSLRNLPHLGTDNDHDSVGLFQQRPSQGWGTTAQLQDPEYAAAAFYRALQRVDGWRQLPLTRAAQAVQRSAHPQAYQRWADQAAGLVAVLNPQAAGWVAPVHAPVVSGFATVRRPGHAGVDLAAARGTVIAAAAGGTVSTVACQARHVDGSWWGCDRDGDPQQVTGCGHYLNITHPDGTLTRYCHLDQPPLVAEGDPVIAGQPVGLVGSTGKSSGPHLHLEVHITGPAGRLLPIDPQQFLRRRGVSLGATAP